MLLQHMLPGALLTAATPGLHQGEGSRVSAWDPYGNQSYGITTVLVQHLFFFFTLMGKHQDSAQVKDLKTSL